MFSNDRNVETIAQLIEVLKHYIGLQSEYVKLLTVLTVVAVFCIILFISLIYLSFAAAYALQPLVGSFIGAFLLVGGFYLLMLIVFVTLRHRLVERPLVRFLGSLFMSK